VISTDAYEAFTEGDGPYDKEVAKRLYESVLAWEILQIKKMLTEVLGDVTPRVMLS
jgi:Zn-dependent oligopeptidase